MLKVRSVSTPARFDVERDDKGTLKFNSDESFGTICVIDGVVGYLFIKAKRGYKTDGASTRWPVSKLLPSWKDEGPYDAAALGHDILYGLEGRVNGLDRNLTPDECDDFLRGVWREAGVSRIVAGIADIFVNLAHNKLHWGADQYGTNKFSAAEWYPICKESD